MKISLRVAVYPCHEDTSWKVLGSNQASGFSIVFCVYGLVADTPKFEFLKIKMRGWLKKEHTLNADGGGAEEGCESMKLRSPIQFPAITNFDILHF